MEYSIETNYRPNQQSVRLTARGLLAAIADILPHARVLAAGAAAFQADDGLAAAEGGKAALKRVMEVEDAVKRYGHTRMANAEPHFRAYVAICAAAHADWKVVRERAVARLVAEAGL